MIYKLDIGYNGNYDDLKTILSFYTVRSVYTGGVKGDLSGGRLQFIDSLESIREQIAYAHSKDVCFNLAINSPCNIKNRDEIQWWNDLIDYLKEIENIGVNGVIVSHPLIMETVKKHTGLKLIVSTICEISTARSARYYEEL